EQQIKIANFLDKKIAEIEELIEKDKKLVGLLKEKRTALINHAVTKGLDPNVKLKDSGIDWIGKIPEGWEVRKLKYLVEDLSGNGFPGEEQGKDAGDVPFYKVGDINGSEKFVEKANNFVSKKTIKDYKWNVIPECSLIAPKIGEALKKNHRKITKVKCIIDNNCIAFKTFDINYNYNYYLFNLINFEWFVNPGAVPSLSVEKLRSLIAPLPPLHEQTSIANFLDKATSKIDITIQKIEQKIKLLEEYKKSLIHHAVTGKIDVREVVA
ncbi:MAG: restriction endonuclease subunit S, partial [Caldisericota bacterium]|nr:restriction endonuclease subunit S [Caldisericota bacterium]